MSHQHLFYQPVGKPDYEALKFQLGSMRGIISMDIDGESSGVSVDSDDIYVNETQISRCLNEIGYRREEKF